MMRSSRKKGKSDPRNNGATQSSPEQLNEQLKALKRVTQSDIEKAKELICVKVN